MWLGNSREQAKLTAWTHIICFCKCSLPLAICFRKCRIFDKPLRRSRWRQQDGGGNDGGRTVGAEVVAVTRWVSEYEGTGVNRTVRSWAGSPKLAIRCICGEYWKAYKDSALGTHSRAGSAPVTREPASIRNNRDRYELKFHNLWKRQQSGLPHCRLERTRLPRWATGLDWNGRLAVGQSLSARSGADKGEGAMVDHSSVDWSPG